MKKLFYLTLILPLFIISCEKSPVARFSTDTNEPAVGQEILFHNESDNAVDYEWDFGDGYISNERDPYHTFNSTGTFDVVLTATSKNGNDDQASLTLTVVIPTLLEIEVLEYFDEYPVANASVILYNSITDWDNQQNMEIEGFTDANGKAVFANLDPFVYYVDVWEQGHDNYTLRDEDIGFIRTPEILPHQINRFIAWVDKATHTKGAKASREMVIRKLERKPAEKSQSESGGTENWQELYNRRINK